MTKQQHKSEGFGIRRLKSRASEIVRAVKEERGSDAVYAAVARRYGSELATLDKEQPERLPKLLPA